MNNNEDQIFGGEEAVVEEPAAEVTEVTEEAEIMEEPEAVEETEVMEEAEVTAQKSGKNWLYVAVMAVLAAILVAGVILLVGKLKAPEEAPVEAPADSMQEEVAEVQPVAGHHNNAYGLPSHSIHYATAEDGSVTYDYRNEAGDLLTVTQEELDALLDAQVALCGDTALTNRQMMYYYQEQFYSFYNTYSAYLAYIMDTSIGMDEQLSADGVKTWQQNFLDAGVQMFHQIAATYNMAKAEGFALSEEYVQEIAGLEETYNQQAALYGFDSADAYMQSVFGPAATLESYLAYSEMSLIASAYLFSIEESTPVTDEDLVAYYTENEEMFLTQYGVEMVDTPVINVRHILVKPAETTAEDGTVSVSDEAWAEAETKANEIYQQWKAGDATEETFAELATLSEDGGSSANGGLYEGVYPGQMVPEFNDWCFDEGRQVGDTGIVKTTYGYHIMYFSGVGEEIYWKTLAKEMLLADVTSDTVANAQMAFPVTYDLSKAILLDNFEPTMPVTETEAQTAE